MELNVIEAIKDTLIKRIETSYTDIIQLYSNIPTAKIVTPDLPNGWSAKDLLTHISAWEWRCASLLEAAHNFDAPLQAHPDVDALNAEIYQERKDWRWEKVKLDARAAHQSLLEAIQQLPPNRLEDSIIKQTIAEETWEHYSEHLPDLRRWNHTAREQVKI